MNALTHALGEELALRLRERNEPRTLAQMHVRLQLAIGQIKPPYDLGEGQTKSERAYLVRQQVRYLREVMDAVAETVATHIGNSAVKWADARDGSTDWLQIGTTECVAPWLAAADELEEPR